MIEVETPFGIVEFPEGTSEQVMRSAIKKQIGQMQQQTFNQQMADTGIGRTMLEQGLQSATFGGGEEIAAGLGALGAKAYGAITGEDMGTLGELYDEGLAQSRARLQQQQEQRPILSMASQIAGGVAPFAAIGKTATGAKVLDSIGKGGLAARAAKGAGLGAASGAAYGFGTGEGSQEQRLESAQGAGVTGLAAGIALPVAGAAIKAVAQPSKTLSKLFSIDPNAAKDFSEAGVEQSIAAISNSPSTKTFQSMLAKFPGASSKLANNINQSLDDIEMAVANQAPKAASISEAGAVIQQGLQGYKDRVMSVANKAATRLERHINPSDTVEAKSALSVLENIANKFASTPELQADIMGKQAAQKLVKLANDVRTNNGVIPYKAIKQYRTDIGDMLGDPMLSTGKAELKLAYGALTEDMKQAFAAKGDRALNEFNAFNKKYSMAMNKIDNFLQPIFAKKTPEQAFRAAFSGTKDGATQLKSIMGSLKPEEKAVVADTFLDKMGKAAAGAQDATGDVFSVNTYLTNWNKLSPEAKNVLFGKDARRLDLDKIARVADRLKDVQRIGGNPSGTAGQLLSGGIGAGIWFEPLTVGSGLLGANATSRLMTNKSFIKWLANAASKESPKAISESIKYLPKIATDNPSLKNDLVRYAAILGEQFNNEVK